MKNIWLLTIALIVLSCNSDNQGSNYDENSEGGNGEMNEVAKTPVEIKQIIPEKFTSYFTATGTVEAVNDAFISPEINGQISKIFVQKGDRVVNGAMLVKLKTEVTQNNIDEVKTSLELAEKLYEKQKQLWEKEIGSEVQYLEAKNGKESLEARLKTLESQLALSSIRAPFSGIIDDISVKTGELASPGMPLLRLVNLDEMRITSMISESFLGNVQKGDTVQLSFSNYEDWTIFKPISRIGTVIDPVTRTFEVEVFVKNIDEKLRPNMLSSLKIQDYSDMNALLVPSIILKEDFNGVFLFKTNEKNGVLTAKKTYVKTGKTVQDVTKITKGINAGDQVIVAGYNLVSDGEPVEVINKQ